MSSSTVAEAVKKPSGRCVPGDAYDLANIRHVNECPGCEECDDLMEFYSGCHVCDRTALKRIMNFDTVTGDFTCDACAAAAAQVPSTLWHCTSARRLVSIQRHGLRTGPKGWSYLSNCRDTAANYENAFDEPTVLLAIDGAALDRSLLGPDDDDVADILNQNRDDRRWNDLSWNESLDLCSQCTYSGHIPPSAIRVEA